MKIYDSIEALIHALDTDRANVPDGWSYFEGEISDLESAKIAVLGDRESMEMERVETPAGRLPKPIHELGMQPLLDIDTLIDVLDGRRKAIPNATLVQFIEAIRHYVVEDDFLD